MLDCSLKGFIGKSFATHIEMLVNTETSDIQISQKDFSTPK